MIRSILVALDGSESDVAVEELSIQWAGHFDANLTGIAIVDDLGIQLTDDGLIDRNVSEAIPVSAAGPTTLTLRRGLQRFGARCREAGLFANVLAAIGSPHEQILLEAQRADLIVMGTRSHFEYGWEGVRGQTLGLVLKDCSRPVVAVPAILKHHEAMPASPRPVVIAYDGSLQAACTLFTFQSSGLGHTRPVHVVSVAPELDDATRHADRALGFLRAHDVEVHGHPQATTRPPADVILEKVHDLGADLLVMGAYGQPTFREFVVGSVTRTVLAKSPVPIFCFH